MENNVWTGWEGLTSEKAVSLTHTLASLLCKKAGKLLWGFEG
jgi:hypothetical protein